ncbi:RNA-guided endonuclease InsQ/TnpB family protein [Limnoraphis robusta]|uniref:RNA-guided endonuclease InsQ/TnpB family protein n=1 Tax=Limnoraphis robusta TaxID=1118279 RepID=UPI002B21F0FE|nr:RNA-guided endonuclease TnpB family protein [Limnoraphis robusta]MEA5500471.1 RNA-guided endonuclease TnpB family protein [Limnoraphis robusta BA-68 BA1]
MKSRYRYRCYPTPSQKLALAKLFGCVRVVWNDSLGFCVSEYKEGRKKPKNSELQKQFITQAKKLEEREWLSEVSAIPLQQSLNDLEQAYKNFFNSCKGKRKGQKVKPPRFKKRKSKQSARFTKLGFSIKGEKVYLAKVGKLKVVWTRELPSERSSVTIIKDSADRYFLSFVVEIQSEIFPSFNSSVGIDLGITTFATLSNGQKIKAPKPLIKRMRKLKKLSKNLSRKTKGSKRYESQRKQLAKFHAKVADTRTDFLHKLSTQIIRENQTIILEDLHVSGMVKNRKLSRAISDLGWRKFRTFLEAKSEKYGRDFRVINRWEPTSKTCSCCGFKIGKLDLSIREWICLNCGISHDRDLNAAVNILVAGGLSDTLSERGGSVRLSQDSSTQRSANPPEFKQLSIFDLLK